MSNYYCITEYSGFANKKNIKTEDSKYILLDDKTFKRLEKTVLESIHNDLAGIMKITTSTYYGKVIVARNYVGLLTLRDGSIIEILPKVYSEDCELDVEGCRKILIKILKTVKRFPFVPECMSGVDVSNMTLLDIYITVFVNEVDKVLKKGIKKDYIRINENAKALKGRLGFREQVTKNFAHQERFFVHYDGYIQNIPQNRIIKTTLLFLLKKTQKQSLIHLIKKYLSMFENVDKSLDIRSDFKKCNSSRLFKHYTIVLKLSKVILEMLSFANYVGEYEMPSLLYPMEKLFEKYVAIKLKGMTAYQGYQIREQDSGHYLVNKPMRFTLRPDIVLRKDGMCAIMDTKWKILFEDSNGISPAQSDMYQMYAYGHKYGASNLSLIYPFHSGVKGLGDEAKEFWMEADIRLRVMFYDLVRDEMVGSRRGIGD